ncbi:hypothetical protein L7F22_047454 [Adiantum nelumboides]|nr:hypothetical protein [Adiantum nelumboides]
MMDYLACWCEAQALPNATATTVAFALFQKIIFSNGCPQQVLLDQGQFCSKVLAILTKCLGINQVFSSPYHPQTNGLTEHESDPQIVFAYLC